jgi:energy-coupling factor transporter ATP-binding protein EcfA2
MDDGLNTLEQWFSKQPKWQQEAMSDICQNGTADIVKIFALFKAEIVNEINIEINAFQHGWLYPENIPVNIHLLKIGNPFGINKLDTRQGLEFGEEQLCLIYGENGAGKSGYTRIIKKLNDRKSSELLPNIFDSRTDQTCDISFLANGHYQNYEQLNLNDSNCAIGIGMMEIFDSSASDAYIRDKHEFSFQPKILRDFSKLGELCSELVSMLESDISEIKITKLNIPESIVLTEYGQKYSQLNSQTDISLFSTVTWTADDENRLSFLATLLSSNDISNSYKLADIKLIAITKLSNVFTKIAENCSLEVQNRIIAERVTVGEQKRVVDEGTRVLNSSCSFSINDITWKALWLAAKTYSEKIAYPFSQFPVYNVDAKCPLCQQKLDSDAITRFESFDEFIKGELNSTLSEQEDILRNSLDKLQLPASTEEIDEWCRTC